VHYTVIIILYRDNLAENEFNYKNNFETHQLIKKNNEYKCAMR